jgi:predicted secreted protein
MAYFSSDPSSRTDPAAPSAPHVGLAEMLFTTLNSAVFLILIAAVAGAAILYAQGA